MPATFAQAKLLGSLQSSTVMGPPPQPQQLLVHGQEGPTHHVVAQVTV
ncbi:MAG: hypothetical protein WCL18_07230 [bacterium]